MGKVKTIPIHRWYTKIFHPILPTVFYLAKTLYKQFAYKSCDMKPVRAHTLQNRHTKSLLSPAKPNVLKVHPRNSEEHTRSIRQKCIKLVALYTKRSRGSTWKRAIKDTT